MPDIYKLDRPRKTDAAYNRGYSDGYQKCKAEQTKEINIDQIVAECDEALLAIDWTSKTREQRRAIIKSAVEKATENKRARADRNVTA